MWRRRCSTGGRSQRNDVVAVWVSSAQGLDPACLAECHLAVSESASCNASGFLRMVHRVAHIEQAIKGPIA
jgi:hypothetical protein